MCVCVCVCVCVSIHTHMHTHTHIYIHNGDENKQFAFIICEQNGFKYNQFNFDSQIIFTNSESILRILCYYLLLKKGLSKATFFLQ